MLNWRGCSTTVLVTVAAPCAYVKMACMRLCATSRTSCTGLAVLAAVLPGTVTRRALLPRTRFVAPFWPISLLKSGWPSLSSMRRAPAVCLMYQPMISPFWSKAMSARLLV